MTVVTTPKLNDEKKNLIKSLYCKNSTDAELQLFLYACQKTGLDPFMKQIYAIKRGNTMTIQTAIDGLRLIAERTGNYSPGKEAEFSYDEKGNLVSATAFIKKRTSDGIWHDVSACAYFVEYNPGQGLWIKMPRAMLSKCAEALALRKAFPAELSGIYTDDEMEQADKKPLNSRNEITEEDWAELDFLAQSLNDRAYEEKVAKHIGIESLHDLKPRDYDKVIRALTNRLKKVEATNGSSNVA